MSYALSIQLITQFIMIEMPPGYGESETAADSPPSRSSQEEPLLLPLSEPACQNPALVGTKAANLAHLVHVLGDAVPLGVVLPVSQSNYFLDIVGSDRYRKASQMLLAALDRPNAARQYAVRSSAVEEDTGSRSFAGQYKTTLGLASTRDIITAIEACVRSAFSSQLAAYRRAAALPGPMNPVGVLIQKMVPADRAGVAFTVHPMTGAADVVINASYGLANLLVSGEVTPDEIIVSSSGQPTSICVGSKRTMSILTQHGVIRTVVPRSLQARPCLSDGQIGAIAATARACEAILGYPIDIEWAFTGGQLFVLQARPITAIRDKRGSHD